ncbi:SMR family transporter [Psychrobacter sp. I-STPA10]|uniref:SMR family transporter n=1 Tax=Psychrobacter sp. I-STPA10 TaxID=2585769 RepID=UPI002E788D54|nr:SMR family transporter [Psychrobacter sp. I-STPA10]
MMMTNPWVLLAFAIVLEVIGTSCLKASNGFSHWGFTLACLLCYVGSFFLLSKIMQVLPIGISYAIWSAVGIVLVSMIGWIFMGQKLDLPAILGIGLIICGVLVIHIFSKTTGH